MDIYYNVNQTTFSALFKNLLSYQTSKCLPSPSFFFKQLPSSYETKTNPQSLYIHTLHTKFIKLKVKQIKFHYRFKFLSYLFNHIKANIAFITLFFFNHSIQFLNNLTFLFTLFLPTNQSQKSKET